MAAVLTGVVRSQREVEGVTQDGPRKGQTWRFLSLEISDPRYGHVFSCQLRDDDEKYAQVVGSDLVHDYDGLHRFLAFTGRREPS